MVHELSVAKRGVSYFFNAGLFSSTEKEIGAKFYRLENGKAKLVPRKPMNVSHERSLVVFDDVKGRFVKDRIRGLSGYVAVCVVKNKNTFLDNIPYDLPIKNLSEFHYERETVNKGGRVITGRQFNKKHSRKIFVFNYDSSNKVASQNWSIEDHDIEDGGIFIEIERFAPTDPTLADNQALSRLSQYVELALGKKAKIFGVKKKEKGRLNNKWISLKEYFTAVLEDVLKEKKEDAIRVLVRIQLLRFNICSIQHLFKGANFSKIDEFVKVLNAKNCDYALDELLQFCGKPPAHKMFQEDVVRRLNEAEKTLSFLNEKFPFIKWLDVKMITPEGAKKTVDMIKKLY